MYRLFHKWPNKSSCSVGGRSLEPHGFAPWSSSPSTSPSSPKEQVGVVLSIPAKVRDIVLGYRASCLLHLAKQNVPQHEVVEPHARSKVVHDLKPLVPELRDLLRRIANPVDGDQVLGTEVRAEVFVDLKLAILCVAHLSPNQQTAKDEFPSGESLQLATERRVGDGDGLYRVSQFAVESGEARTSIILKRLELARCVVTFLEPLHFLLVAVTRGLHKGKGHPNLPIVQFSDGGQLLREVEL